jgi:hypothetical protein
MAFPGSWFCKIGYYKEYKNLDVAAKSDTNKLSFFFWGGKGVLLIEACSYYYATVIYTVIPVQWYSLRLALIPPFD